MSLSRRQFIKAGALFVPAAAYGQWNAFNRNALARADNLLQGLTSYWKMDDVSASAKNDTVDSNNLSQSQGFVANVTGVINVGGSITGAGSDGWQCANNTNLQMGAGVGFTISFWTIPTQDNNGKTLISKWHKTQGAQQEWNIVPTAANSSNLQLQVKDLSNATVTVQWTGTLSTTWWNHIAAGFDPLRQAIWIQVNNSARVYTACSGVIKVGATPPQFAIGQYSANATGAANGYYDEVGFWRRSLSPEEVAMLYGNSIAIAYPFTTTRAFDIATNWQNRVVTNGGALPSRATVEALETFINNIASTGVYPFLQMVNPVAPDNLTAARTPLFVGPGNDPWTNNNFVGGDLTVNGLAGNGSNKYLQTGFLTTSLNASNYGFTAYCSSANNLDESEFGAWTTTTGFRLDTNSTVGHFAQMSYAGGNGSMQAAVSNFTGYVSANRVANNDARFYHANSGTAHAQAGTTNTNVIADERATVNKEFWAWANNNNGVVQSATSRRISFLAIHNGLTAAQSLNFFNCIQALRMALGGGYV